MTLRKRFSMGFEYQFAFTYSHGMSDAIGYYGQGGQAGSQSAYWQNLYNQAVRNGVRRTSTTSSTLRGSFVYQLPFGKGRSMDRTGIGASTRSWAAGSSAAFRPAHTGFPLTIKYDERSVRHRRAQLPSQRDRHAQRSSPDRTGRAVAGYPAAYATPTKGTFGNAGVGIVRGPGMARFDLSLAQAVPHHGEEILRAPRGSFQPDQHADLPQSGVADHHVARCSDRSAAPKASATCRSSASSTSK